MKYLLLLPFLFVLLRGKAQDPAALLQKVRARLDQVKDYQATGLMKTNVPFLKVPESRLPSIQKSGQNKDPQRPGDLPGPKRSRHHQP